MEAAAILEGLNPPQREAVEVEGGPLLILAGPGSGKTRVIAHRIAYLVRVRGVPPWRIIAVTFTNKAAREMVDRVHSLLGGFTEGLTLGTFHATCARLLRREAAAAGLDAHFVIYDDDDQIGVMKRVVADLGLDPKRYAPRSLLSTVSRAKSEMVGPAELARNGRSYYDEVAARAYESYDAKLAQAKALDFDDLLLRTVRLFNDQPDVLERYAERYLHLLVDEFQDTNVVQCVLARQLASRHRNICVVGDPDQSIYSWRSADIRNILNFEYDFPDARVVLLEQNYRSTQTILEAARRVIARNRQRKDNNLWTENEPGVPITIAEAYNEDEEAEFVAVEVERLVARDGLTPKDVAVMYRVNAQSRAVEEAFLRHSLPYRLVGATRFYERREVKDLLSYLRLIQNPYDDISFVRVLNVPGRGIGQRTQEALAQFATATGVPLYAALQVAVGDEAPGALHFAARIRHALADFLEVLNSLIAQQPTLPPPELLDKLVEAIGYRNYLLADERGEECWENVLELRGVAAQFADAEPADALAAFLEGVVLVSPGDDYDAVADAVTLITLHAAKGLEFPVVFILGLEDGVLPHRRSLDDPLELEEERRLCYVGMTRAKQRLYLLRAFRRSLGGMSNTSEPSRFLRDVPPELVAFRNRPGELWETAPRPARAPSSFSGRTAFDGGDRVHHAVFGDGVVVSCTPSGDDYQVVVAFRGEVGVKRLLLSLAPLRKADGAPPPSS